MTSTISPVRGLTSKGYTEADYEPFMRKLGRSDDKPLPLPNAEDVDPLEFLNALAAGGHMMTPHNILNIRRIFKFSSQSRVFCQNIGSSSETFE